MLPQKRERERERERERVLFFFFFFLGALSQYLPTLNDEGTAAWSFSRRGNDLRYMQLSNKLTTPTNSEFFKTKMLIHTITNKKQTTPTQTDDFFYNKNTDTQKTTTPTKSYNNKDYSKTQTQEEEEEEERERERERESVCVCVFAADKGWWKKDVVIRMCDKMFAPLLSF
jgi:hypothetical protein